MLPLAIPLRNAELWRHHLRWHLYAKPSPEPTLYTLEQSISQAVGDVYLQSGLRNFESSARSSTQGEFRRLLEPELSLAKRLLAEDRLKKDA
jgi:hypothetical protein